MQLIQHSQLVPGFFPVSCCSYIDNMFVFLGCINDLTICCNFLFFGLHLTSKVKSLLINFVERGVQIYLILAKGYSVFKTKDYCSLPFFCNTIRIVTLVL